MFMHAQPQGPTTLVLSTATSRSICKSVHTLLLEPAKHDSLPAGARRSIAAVINVDMMNDATFGYTWNVCVGVRVGERVCGRSLTGLLWK